MRTHRAVAREQDIRVNVLRTKVREREEDLRELREWYARIQVKYQEKVRELSKAIKGTRKEYRALIRTRAEAHSYFTEAIREVRERLSQYETARMAQAAGFSSQAFRDPRSFVRSGVVRRGEVAQETV